jgi:hypothetical protein
MVDDDDEFALDAAGNRVLIGLSLEETIEFELLNNATSADRPLLHISRDHWQQPEEKRWLALWEKHETAKAPFRGTSRTRH